MANQVAQTVTITNPTSGNTYSSSVDVSKYSRGSFQVVGLVDGDTVWLQYSNDGSHWADVGYSTDASQSTYLPVVSLPPQALAFDSVRLKYIAAANRTAVIEMKCQLAF